MAALAAAAAPAAAPGLTLKSSRARTGAVALRVHGLPGERVALSERVGSRRVPVVTLTLDAKGDGASTTPWLCARSHRRFEAAATAASATSAIDTPTCAKRLGLAVTRRPRPGVPLRVTVRDPWRAGGLRARVCLALPGLHRCAVAGFAAGDGAQTLAFMPRVAGRGTVTLTTRYGQRVLRHLTVRRRPGTRLRVLATGDSMIQIVDSFLKQRLGRLRGVSVRSDAHISTGISKPFLFDWAAHARRQAAGHPDVTVMFIGANDGFDMGGARCCGAAWVAEYARRAGRMMSAYEQGGGARVYWITLPVPGRPAFKPIYRAVNLAIRRAASRTGGLVRILDFEAFFTPHGVFQQSITFRGRRYSVRQGDHVHLNTAGARIGATLIAEAMARDGLLG